MRREPKETEAGQGHPGFFSSFPQALKGECAILASGSQPGSTPPLGPSRVGVEVPTTTGSGGVGPAGHMEGPLAPGELLCQGLGPPWLRPHLPLCICPGWGLRGRQPGCSLPSAGAHGGDQTEASRVPTWALSPGSGTHSPLLPFLPLRRVAACVHPAACPGLLKQRRAEGRGIGRAGASRLGFLLRSTTPFLASRVRLCLTALGFPVTAV